MSFLYKTRLSDNALKMKFLGGFFALKMDFANSLIFWYILGIKLFKSEIRNAKFSTKLFGLFRINSRLGLKRILFLGLEAFLAGKIDIENKQFLAINHRFGETFLIFSYLKSFCEKNGYENIVCISPNSSMKSIVKMFMPNTKFICIPKIFWDIHRLNLNKQKFGKNSLYIELLNSKYFINLEAKVQKGIDTHFLTALTEQMGVDKSNFQQPVISEETKRMVDLKLKRLNLGEKFVFVSPQAQSNGTMSNKFWNTLSNLLYEKGYEVLYNSIPVGICNSYDKTSFFTLEEARYVAEKANYVVGIRSGLLDVIASKNTTIHCIYKPFSKRSKELPAMSAEKVLQTFTLKKLPNVDENKIFEYNSETLSEKDVLNQIVGAIIE